MHRKVKLSDDDDDDDEEADAEQRTTTRRCKIRYQYYQYYHILARFASIPGVATYFCIVSCTPLSPHWRHKTC